MDENIGGRTFLGFIILILLSNYLALVYSQQQQKSLLSKYKFSLNPNELTEWSGPLFISLPVLDVLVSTPDFPLFRNRRLSPLVLPQRGHRGFTPSL